MKASIRSGALALALGTLVAGPPAAAQTTLVFNQITPATHFFHAKLLVPWAERVAAATGNRVKVRFTGSSLGPFKRQFDLALEGVADITTGNHAPIAGRFPLTLIVQQPFLGDSAEAVSVALWRVHEKHLAKAGEHDGVKLLTLFTSGPIGFFSIKKPINSSADTQGIKLRVSGTAVTKMVRSLGAVTVSSPVSQMYEMVSKGIVDGAVTTGTGASGFKVDKFLNHQTVVPGGLAYGPFFIVMNQKKWDGLSAADRDAISGLSGEGLARMGGRLFDEEDRKAMEKRVASGTEVITASDAFLAELKRKFAFVEQEWVSMADGKGIDGAAALAMVREVATGYERP